MTSEELKKLISEVRRHEPAQTTLDIHQFIKAHRIKSTYEVRKFIKNFEDFFDELSIIIKGLNFVSKNDWKHHKSVQYIFYPEALKTLHRAFEDTIDGYYDEAMMLLRSVYETFWRIVFLSCYPNDWEAVFIKRPKKLNFNLSSFIKDNLMLDWEFLYRIMCKIHHSKVHKNLSTLIRISKPNVKEMISMKYQFEKKFLFMAVNIINLNLCCFYHGMLAIFENDILKHQKLKVRIKRLKKIDRILLGIIENNSVTKFASLANDIKKIGKIIKVADSGKNWKKIALKI